MIIQGVIAEIPVGNYQNLASGEWMKSFGSKGISRKATDLAVKFSFPQ